MTNAAKQRSIENKKANKAFKRDSQRLAFLLSSLGFVFTVVWLGFVVALLTPLRRYTEIWILKNVEAFLVNSFTENGTGGNPAGVVLHADHLSNEEKLQIAQAVGYSETAFVSLDDEADFELSFFTITGEVDFCGHATLAAFSTMYQDGIITEGKYLQRTKAGLLVVTIEANGHIVMDQK